MTQGLSANSHHAVWVPAFAGTTAEVVQTLATQHAAAASGVRQPNRIRHPQMSPPRTRGPITTILACRQRTMIPGLSNKIRRGVWVPAFAGTTAVLVAGDRA